MQTFAEWLDAELARRGWTAADLTTASQTPDNPKGLNSGLISRWRRKDALAVVPTQAKTLNRLARALDIGETEVYRAAGQLPNDVNHGRDKSRAERELARRQQSQRQELERWLAVLGPQT